MHLPKKCQGCHLSLHLTLSSAIFVPSLAPHRQIAFSWRKTTILNEGADSYCALQGSHLAIVQSCAGSILWRGKEVVGAGSIHLAAEQVVVIVSNFCSLAFL